MAKEVTEDGTAQRYAGMFARLYTFVFEVVSMRIHACIYVVIGQLRFIGLGHSDHAPGQAINPCTLPADSGPLQRTGEQRKERQRRKCSPPIQ